MASKQAATGNYSLKPAIPTAFHGAHRFIGTTPTLDSISPASAYRGTSVDVTFTGSGLSSTTAVRGWGQNVTVSNLSVSDNTVTATFTLNNYASIGTHNLRLVNPSGSTNTVPFQVLAGTAPPVVNSIGPASASQGQTVNVTFSGTNLSGTTAINGFGGNATVSNLAASANTVTATIAINSQAAVQTYPLTLSTSSGTTNAVSFQVTAASVSPSVTSVSPATATQGQTVNVTFSGANLSGTTGINGFGTNATVSSLVASASKVTATIALNSQAAVQTYSLALSTSSGTTNAVSFQVTAASVSPSVTSVSPATATQGQTVNVTFSGANLSGTTGINGFGTNATASSLVASASTVTATIALNSQAAVQTYSLTLSTPSGTSNAVSFKVTAAPVSTLTVSPSSLAFGNDSVGTADTQTLTLSSTGSSAVTVNSGTISGTGFSMSGATFPVTLNPGVAITLQVQFDPPAAGTDTGSASFASTSSSGSPTAVALSGTGTHWVSIGWTAPVNSPAPISGYNVYRAPSGSSSYVMLNSSPVPQTTFPDNGVSSGSSYSYYLESVSNSGVASVPSSPVTVSVP